METWGKNKVQEEQQRRHHEGGEYGGSNEESIWWDKWNSSRMKAMKQVLEFQSKSTVYKNGVSKNIKQQAEAMQKSFSVQSSQPTVATPPALKYQCHLCGLRFPPLPDLGQHHQEKHLTVKQAVTTNGLGEPKTGLYTLSKDGVLMSSSSKPYKQLLLSAARPSDSKEILDIAHFACCKA